MNAAIRAVVRAAIGRGVKVIGFRHGYEGILKNEFKELESSSVGGIISYGGTMLRTARSKEFFEPENQKKAIETMRGHGAEGLAVIGGDGSLTGALALHDQGFAVVGIPASIDNDISGTDYSIGFDTAVNTAVEAIDRVRDTAYSHERVFVIEVMGRRNGLIALEAGLAGGAESILLPEVPFSLMQIVDEIRSAADKGKRSSIIIVAEGAGSAMEIRDFIYKNTRFEVRYLVLGHMQRGGNPSAFDRVLALRLGAYAATRLATGHSGEMVGIEAGVLVSRPLAEVLKIPRTIDQEKLILAEVMAQ